MEPRGVEELAGAVESQEASVLLTVGTMKGAWLFAGDPERGKWRGGAGRTSVESRCTRHRFDGRGGGGGCWPGPSMGAGAVVRSSDDLGRSWVSRPENLRFPGGDRRRPGQGGKRLQPASDDRPGTV